MKSSSNICFGYLLESPQRGDSNKYPKHMFYEEIRIKQGLSNILVCPLRILYNSKFMMMAIFLGTVIVVTRVQSSLYIVWIKTGDDLGLLGYTRFFLYGRQLL